MWIRRCFVLATAVIPSTLGAQNSASLAGQIDIVAGVGRGGDYDHRSLASFSVAGSFRYLHGRIGVLSHLGKDAFGRIYGFKAMCQVRANGTCAPMYPDFTGWAAGIGVLVRPLRAVEAGATVGHGWYRVRFPAPGNLNATIGLIDLSIYPVSHVGIGGGVRLLNLGRYGDDRLSMFPVNFGIRVR